MSNTQKIESIRAFQECGKRGVVHPLTCGNDSKHILEGVERNDAVILKCPQCDYEQTFVPEFIYDSFRREDYE